MKEKKLNIVHYQCATEKRPFRLIHSLQLTGTYIIYSSRTGKRVSREPSSWGATGAGLFPIKCFCPTVANLIGFATNHPTVILGGTLRKTMYHLRLFKPRFARRSVCFELQQRDGRSVVLAKSNQLLVTLVNCSEQIVSKVLDFSVLQLFYSNDENRKSLWKQSRMMFLFWNVSISFFFLLVAIFYSMLIEI